MPVDPNKVPTPSGNVLAPHYCKMWMSIHLIAIRHGKISISWSARHTKWPHLQHASNFHRFGAKKRDNLTPLAERMPSQSNL